MVSFHQVSQSKFGNNAYNQNHISFIMIEKKFVSKILTNKKQQMELIPGSETSTHLIQTPGIYPENNTLRQQHGESLKTKKTSTFNTINFCYS
jgi:hypothetical protein